MVFSLRNCIFSFNRLLKNNNLLSKVIERESELLSLRCIWEMNLGFSVRIKENLFQSCDSKEK